MLRDTFYEFADLHGNTVILTRARWFDCSHVHRWVKEQGQYSDFRWSRLMETFQIQFCDDVCKLIFNYLWIVYLVLMWRVIILCRWLFKRWTMIKTLINTARYIFLWTELAAFLFLIFFIFSVRPPVWWAGTQGCEPHQGVVWSTHRDRVFGRPEIPPRKCSVHQVRSVIERS